MIFIALGSNLPFLGKMPSEIIFLASHAVTELGDGMRLSSLYQSEACPDPTKPHYINAVLSLEKSDLQPSELLQALHAIERGFGRHRAISNDPKTRYAPRTLDLDLLNYHDVIIQPQGDNGLGLPHHGIAKRDFVLLPLVELAPEWCHPTLAKTAFELLKNLQSHSREGTTIKLTD